LGEGNGDDDGDFGIGAGRYYVDGLLAESHRPQRYRELGGAPLESGRSYVVYLDVWEEFIAPQQDPALDPVRPPAVRPSSCRVITGRSRSRFIPSPTTS
jgi:hypothetical protein